MRLHPRELNYSRAEAEFATLLLKFREKYSLSDFEMVMILSSELQAVAKYGIRMDRHGNY